MALAMISMKDSVLLSMIQLMVSMRRCQVTWVTRDRRDEVSDPQQQHIPDVQLKLNYTLVTLIAKLMSLFSVREIIVSQITDHSKIFLLTQNSPFIPFLWSDVHV